MHPLASPLHPISLKEVDVYLISLIPNRRRALILALSSRYLISTQREVVVARLRRDAAAPRRVPPVQPGLAGLVQDGDHVRGRYVNYVHSHAEMNSGLNYSNTCRTMKYRPNKPF